MIGITDTGAQSGNDIAVRFNVAATPATFSVGLIPANHFLESLIVIITNAGTTGTKLRIVDQNNSDILQNPVPAALLRTSSQTPNLMVTEDKTLTGVIEGYEGSNTVSGWIIKKFFSLEE